MSLLDQFVPNRRIAYFSMQLALRSEIRTYAGGLGMLAGDVARACADLELPLVFVTLIGREGYLRQDIDAGRQVDHPDPWEPEAWATKLDAKIALRIEWREVWVRPWLYLVEGPAGYEVPVILLDTDLEENTPEDRRITHRLYGGDQADRLRQEIVLGIGAPRILRALGFEIHTYHLNEGHAETSRRMFKGYRFHAVTNGVHATAWTAESFARLYQAHIPHWQHEPELLVRADRLPDAEVWAAHQEAKRALLSRVEEVGGVAMDLEVPLIAWARRMTGYKRPELLFSDLERFVAIHRRHPFQVVFAGKAHPQDGSGKQAIEGIHRRIVELAGVLPIAFLPNYDMELARYLVAGADVWLNTPLPPLEASGTSGMKAALNGVLNFSGPDGWWQEALIEDDNGWGIGDGTREDADQDAASLYDKLEHKVLPLYYNDRAKWIWMMKQSISKIASYFNSHRMMRRYAAEAYLR